jgi:hypothetical protein
MTPDPSERAKEEVIIVDLSGPSPRSRRVQERKLHREVLAFVESRGEATKADLATHFRQVPYEDLIMVVEDLSILGKVELRWTSPFSFTVRPGSAGSTTSPSPKLVVA